MHLTKNFTIQGNEYEIGRLNAFRAVEIVYDLAKYTSGPIGKLAGSAMSGGVNRDVGDLDLSAALDHFFEKCPRKEFTDLMQELCTKNVLRNNRPVNFQLDFQGNLQEAFELFTVVLRYNFEDFFKNVVGKIARQIPSTSHQSTSVRSTGTSGGPSSRESLL